MRVLHTLFVIPRKTATHRVAVFCSLSKNLTNGGVLYVLAAPTSEKVVKGKITAKLTVIFLTPPLQSQRSICRAHSLLDERKEIPVQSAV